MNRGRFQPGRKEGKSLLDSCCWRITGRIAQDTEGERARDLPSADAARNEGGLSIVGTHRGGRQTAKQMEARFPRWRHPTLLTARTGQKKRIANTINTLHMERTEASQVVVVRAVPAVRQPPTKHESTSDETAGGAMHERRRVARKA